MTRQMKLISAIVVVLAIGLVTALLIMKYSPSKEVMDLNEYYKVTGDNDLVIVLQDEISEERGLINNGVPYVKYDTVKGLFNKKFYWDSNDQILIYTTPEKVIKINPDTNEYKINKGKDSKDYVIVALKDGDPYIALPFVKEYSNMDYEVFELPNRVVITYKWGYDELRTLAKKDTEIRLEPSIKSPILANVSIGDELLCVDSTEDVTKGFTKVLTTDGVLGYAKTKRLEESHYETTDIPPEKEKYIHITKDHDINMVWHQVSSQAANDNMLGLFNRTKGVNTICPTWFSLKDEKGNINSLASEDYVTRAHNAGMEVWGLCDDFTGQADVSVVLSKTSSREKLENKLISNAIEYNLDGINIDFEKIVEEHAEDFIQFIRELSIKCRNNGIVLSIDNYVPVPYREYYNYEEQTEVADYIVIMAYDEHYSGSETAGSVSSIEFVKNAAVTMSADFDKDRVIMGLPFYTRLWKTAAEGTPPESEAYGMDTIEDLLAGKGVKAAWENATAQNYAEFDDNGVKCQVWLEDEKSLEEKLTTITSLGIHNVSFWRLGFEKTEIWNTVGKFINKK